MTTRMLRTQKTRRPPVVLLHCPACRSPQRCRPVGTATVAGQRREVVQCGARDCELLWIPERGHIVTAA